MESEPTSDQYYVLRGQDTEGPLAKEALFSMRKDGMISDDNLICRVGDSQWTQWEVLFPSAKQALAPPPPPPAPTLSVGTIALPVSGQISKEDRQGLHDYLVTAMRSRKEGDGEPFFKDALAKTFPALGILLEPEPTAGRENRRCEALFLLHKLLDLSATYLDAAPWVTYLAAKKHAHWTDRFGIATAAFADFSNKKLVDEVARLADTLEDKASALMDSETSANIRELIRFQDRKGRLALAISILNEAIASPHRSLILKRLNHEEATVSGHYLAVPPEGKIQEIASGCWYMAFFLIGIPLYFRKQIEAEGIVASNAAGSALIIGLLFLIFAIFLQLEASVRRKKKEEVEMANNKKREHIQSIEVLVNRLVEALVPLLDDLQVVVTLDDLEDMVSQLEAYGTRGREMEGFYIKT